MRIIVDENIPGVEHFLTVQESVHYLPGRSISADDVATADALLVRSVTPVNAALLKNSTVRFVGSATAGIDHVDLQWLKKQGIHFVYAPGCNAVAVAEYVLTAINAASVYYQYNWMHKTVGIIGHGHVGGYLHRILKSAGVACIVYDPFAPADDGSDVTLSELLQSADIVTLHTPLTKTGSHPTWHMIGSTELNMMKPNALLINTSRGAVTDNAALSAHLNTHPRFTAVLDVWENEPTLNTTLLQQVFIATGHIAGYTPESKLKSSKIVCDALCDYLAISEPGRSPWHLPKTTICLKAIKKSINTVCFPQVLQQLFRQLYAIEQDSLHFKQLISHAATTEDVATTFDKYRRSYQKRREFFSAQSTKESVNLIRQKNPDLFTLLYNLGFHFL